MAEDPEDLSWVLEADKKLKCKANKRLPNAESSLPGLNKFKVLSESSNIETACTPSSHSSSKLSQAEISGKYSVLKIQQDKNQDILRKLKLVKCHKKKNNLETLDKLIKKWQSVCQDALAELLEFSPKQPPTTMQQLLTYLAIDPNQVKFDLKTNTFIKDSTPAT